MKVSNKRLIDDNEVFNIYYCRVDDGQGNVVPNYLVVEPKNVRPDLLTGVAVLPIVGEKFGLINIYRPALMGEFWEIPHGFIDQGETGVQACIRELKEETGIECSPEDIEFLDFIAPDSGVLRGTANLYVAKAPMPTLQTKSEIGLGEFRLFSKAEVLQMIADKQIADSFSLVSIYKYLLTS